MYWLLGRQSILSVHNKHVVEANPKTHVDVRRTAVGMSQAE
jgi:hypothetical protein